MIEETFTPLVLKCKELGRAIRIGTNHGSLSARILSYYGDTPRCALTPHGRARGRRPIIALSVFHPPTQAPHAVARLRCASALLRWCTTRASPPRPCEVQGVEAWSGGGGGGGG